MKINSIKFLEGANIYCHRPILKVGLDLEQYANITTEELPQFTDILERELPSLKEHYCSRGRPGGFIERLREGTLLGHVVEHVALELQHLAGFDVVYGKTVESEHRGQYHIILEVESKEGGIQAIQSAIHIVNSLLENNIAKIDKEINKVSAIAAKHGLGPSTGAIAKEALKRNIPVMRLGEGSILQLGYGKYQQRVQATITGRTKCISVDIACDKSLVKQLLSEAGIPVPVGGIAGSEGEGIKLANAIGGPVVVKPFDGNQGKGVFLNLSAKPEIIRALEGVFSISPKAIVEKYVSGRHYRMAVVGGKVIAASERIPAFVVGDGVSSVRHLVQMVNQDPWRGDDHDKPLTIIKIDSVVLTVLAKKGYSPESIPKKGELVYLRENANISTGGIAIDVTDEVHPETADLVLRAVNLIGLDVAGVDLVIKEIGEPLTPDNGAIIEINAAPGIRMHHFPAKGKPRNVAGEIVKLLFPTGTNSRIPIIAVTGTNGKTTVTRMVSHILRKTGSVVGMTTTDGIFINEKKVVSGDTTGPLSVKAVLRDPSVQVAVFETARGGILRSGLGYDHSDVAIITNVSNDHLGLEGVETLEDMAFVKAVVAEAVHENGLTVLNADDINVAALSKRIKSGVVYFSTVEDNLIVRRHLGFGGTAVLAKKNSLIVAVGTKAQRVLSIKNLPCTLGGIVSHNVQNALAAIAGCIALGIKIDDIRKGLLSFASSEESNPGRFNLFEMGKYRVVLDYGHNEAGYLNTLGAIKRLKPKRIIGVVGMPGDRKDQDLITVGEIASSYCDHLVVKEDMNLRGRKPGEVAGLICQGALNAGHDKSRITIVLSELSAVADGLTRVADRDILVIFYENLESVRDLIYREREKITGEQVSPLICESTG